jgi:RNA polymerase sigma-70 factor (ECF subfamily)
LVAWRKVDSFAYHGATADEEFVRWLCTIARYEVLTWRRSQAASHSIVLEDSLLDRIQAIQFQESAYLEQRHQALVHCIQKLRPRDREMAQLFYDAQSAVRELAVRFGIGVHAVYKSLTRIRATLLECIQRTVQREECR